MAKERQIIEPLVLENEETGETLVFEYDRAIILRMEREGISISSLGELMDEKPLLTTIDLIYYGLLKHQPKTTKQFAEDLFFESGGFDNDFMDSLGELLRAPYEALTSAVPGNAKWRRKSQK